MTIDPFERDQKAISDYIRKNKVLSLSAARTLLRSDAAARGELHKIDDRYCEKVFFTVSDQMTPFALTIDIDEVDTLSRLEVEREIITTVRSYATSVDDAYFMVWSRHPQQVVIGGSQEEHLVLLTLYAA